MGSPVETPSSLINAPNQPPARWLLATKDNDAGTLPLCILSIHRVERASRRNPGENLSAKPVTHCAGWLRLLKPFTMLRSPHYVPRYEGKRCGPPTLSGQTRFCRKHRSPLVETRIDDRRYTPETTTYHITSRSEAREPSPYTWSVTWLRSYAVTPQKELAARLRPWGPPDNIRTESRASDLFDF